MYFITNTNSFHLDNRGHEVYINNMNITICHQLKQTGKYSNQLSASIIYNYS